MKKKLHEKGRIFTSLVWAMSRILYIVYKVIY